MPQNLYQMLRDLLDQIIVCLDDDPCPYDTFISRGLPPADCSSIAGWFGGSSRENTDNEDCSASPYESTLHFTITHCCVTPDQGLGFDAAREEVEAECFLTNLAAIRECLTCYASEVVSQYALGCGARVTRVSMDPEARGGCYSATISIEVVEQDCC